MNRSPMHVLVPAVKCIWAVALWGKSSTIGSTLINWWIDANRWLNDIGRWLDRWEVLTTTVIFYIYGTFSAVKVVSFALASQNWHWVTIEHNRTDAKGLFNWAEYRVCFIRGRISRVQGHDQGKEWKAVVKGSSWTKWRNVENSENYVWRASPGLGWTRPGRI